MIGIVNDESKRINNDDKDENDSDNDNDSDSDCIHPPRGVERRAKLGAGHSESNNTDYINIIYNIYLYRYYCSLIII